MDARSPSTHSTQAGAAISDVSERGGRVGRFRLDDLVTRDAGGSVWKGADELLGRPVRVRIVLQTDPRIDSVRAAACDAARVADRRVLRVLDVLTVDSALVIISEWVDALSLTEFLPGPIPTAQAVELAAKVAQAVQAIHRSGTTHGRITPSSVLMTSDGELKLRGHGVDAALWGQDFGSDPVGSDLFAVGAVLMACLTARWPLGPKDGLRAVPMTGGVLAAPSQLIAGLPAAVDSIVVRCMASAPGRRAPHSVPPYPDIDSLVAALMLAQHETAGTQSQADAPRPTKLIRRTAAVVAGIAAAAAIAAAGVGLIVATIPKGGPSAEGQANAPTWRPPPSAAPMEPEVRLQPTEDVLPVSRVWALAPARAGAQPGPASGSEEAAMMLRAVTDARPSTSWRTPLFRTATAAKSTTPGLVLDLGAERTVRAIDIGLLGDGTNLAVSASTKLPKAAPQRGQLASLAGAAPLTTVRWPRPVTARYLVISFSRVPAVSGGYQGGVADIVVKGS